MKYVYIKTFGCQMNEYDTEYITSVFLNRGFERTDIPDKANYIILNTCSIRDKPEHKVFSELGKFGKLFKTKSFKLIISKRKSNKASLTNITIITLPNPTIVKNS